MKQIKPPEATKVAGGSMPSPETLGLDPLPAAEAEPIGADLGTIAPEPIGYAPPPRITK